MTIKSSGGKMKKMSKVKAIEEYGRLYVERFLKQQIADKDEFLRDWHKALRFLFTKVFYRGRKDELSERFMNAVFNSVSQKSLLFLMNK